MNSTKSEITMKICIDKRAHHVEVYRDGHTTPLLYVGDDTHVCVAEAWKYIAAYAMEAAFYLEHANDFMVPEFRNADRVNMAMQICREHENPFEGAEQ